MDAYEATKIVYQRIQTLDPEKASKIMGLLLIQDHGEKEMIRLAFGPENSIHSVILKAKKELGLSSPNTPLSLTRHSSFSSASSKLLISTPNSYKSSLSSPMNSKATPFYANGDEIDLIDELQLQDQLSFLNDDAAGNWGGENGGAAVVNGLPHRRSCSVSDMCLYYARGYCKNGSTCRFLHGEGGGALAAADGGGIVVGSPNNFEFMEQELLRSKSTHQQRMAVATQLMAASNFPYSPVNSSRELMVGDGMNKFSRNFGINYINPGSRQIYLTFPADSTFKEEDVSNYFSIFGPVQDVRIPYQQKRMFGFVTFEYSDTVKLILAKGNPHFVCDARVLVKPYKEKGKIPERHRRQQQQIERGDYPGCGSPTGLESRDPCDFQLGARMFYNTQDILWRRKLEDEAELQHAIELQNRRLMSLQLLDVKRNNHHRAFSTGAAISSPTYSPSFFNQNVVLSGDQSSPESKEENGSIGNLANFASDVEGVMDKYKDFYVKIDNSKLPLKESDFQESLEHNLPDSPFASPKAAGNHMTTFSTKTMSEAEKGNTVVTQPCDANTNFVTSPSLYLNSSLDMAPFKLCHFHVPGFSSGHETIGI